jgi:shikimate dehydrogenase
VGANTDVRGFAVALAEAGIDPAGRRAVVVGSGGAALAVGVALVRGGVGSLVLAARRPERAERVRERCLAVDAGIAVRAATLDPSTFAGAELVVVASSGRAEALEAVDPSALGEGAAWVDLNYWDPDPPGLRRAAAHGLRTTTGDGMLRAQAALSFEAWTGRPPPLQAQRRSW